MRINGLNKEILMLAVGKIQESLTGEGLSRTGQCPVHELPWFCQESTEPHQPESFHAAGSCGQPTSPVLPVEIQSEGQDSRF